MKCFTAVINESDLKLPRGDFLQEFSEDEILFMMQDHGGTQNVGPVYFAFKGMISGVTPIIIASEAAPNILKTLPHTGAFVYRIYNEIADVVKDYPNPALVVASMDSGPSVGRNAMSVYRGICPTVALPDTPWGRFGSDWKAKEFWPEYLIVNDEVCKRVVLEIWQGYPQEQIRIFPWPLLDRFYGVNLDQLALAFRSQHCVVLNKPMILFVGQLRGTGKVLRQVVEALNMMQAGYYFVPRLHPRADAIEQADCADALAALKTGTLVANTSEFKTLDLLIAAARVVVSAYSTALAEAAAMRRFNISVMTPAGLAAYHADIGNRPARPSFGEIGYSREVATTLELRRALELSLARDFANPLAQVQAEKLPAEGDNAERVARFLYSLYTEHRRA